MTDPTVAHQREVPHPYAAKTSTTGRLFLTRSSRMTGLTMTSCHWAQVSGASRVSAVSIRRLLPRYPNCMSKSFQTTMRRAVV
jgi:hypothetical protein